MREEGNNLFSRKIDHVYNMHANHNEIEEEHCMTDTGLRYNPGHDRNKKKVK